MSEKRDHWVQYKKNVKTKDWEGKLKLKDDFGPTLDVLEAKADKLEKLVKQCEKLIASVKQTAKKAAVIRKSYISKIRDAGKEQLIPPDDARSLSNTLEGDDWWTSKFTTSRLAFSDFEEALRKSEDFFEI